MLSKRNALLQAIREEEYGFEVSRMLADADPPELRADKDVVLIAVRKDGLSLQHASPGLRNDKDVVLAAVKEVGHSLGYASELLRADKAVVNIAVRISYLSLVHAAKELQEDPEITSVRDEVSASQKKRCTEKLESIQRKYNRLTEKGLCLPRYDFAGINGPVHIIHGEDYPKSTKDEVPASINKRSSEVV